MQFRDLQRQYNLLKPRMDQALVEVAASGRYIMGDKVVELERKLADYVGVEHCISCASGTDALYLALRVMGVGAGDAVFVPDFTFFASAEVVSLVGATPVFVDVEEETFNISPDDLERKIKQLPSGLSPKVVMAVDLFGLPANYPAVCTIAQRYGLLVLEDGAQGFGGSINGKKACSFGDVATTSFFPSKPLGCYGDGGAIFTDNGEWAEKARSLRQHGKGADKYSNIAIGVNSRLDAIQAAILLVKLEVFDRELALVGRHAAKFASLMGEKTKAPRTPEGYCSAWAQYTIRCKDEAEREAIRERMAEKGIPTMVYYPTPLHALPVYAQDKAFPVATQLSRTVLSLPMHPYLTDDEIELIASTL